MHPSVRRHHGFTLLELLIAMAIFAIIAVAAYSGLRSVLASQRALETEARRLAALQLAWTMIGRDIEQAVPRPLRDEFGTEQPPLRGDANARLVLEFTRTGRANPLGRRQSALQRIAYRVTGERLERLTWPVLDRGDARPPTGRVLLEGVETIELRFLDAAGRWRRRWPTDSAEAASAPLPRAVELRLRLRGWGELRRLFVLAGAP